MLYPDDSETTPAYSSRSTMAPRRILVIAGSDSSGGAYVRVHASALHQPHTTNHAAAPTAD